MDGQQVEVLHPIDLPDAVTRIGASWRKAAESILETAKLLHDYNLREGWDDLKSKLIAQNIMKDAVISMLLGIGRNQCLMQMDPKMLPPSYNTLYSMSRVDEKTLQKKLEKGEIGPDLLLEDARDWVASVKTKNTVEKKSSTPHFKGTIGLKFPYVRGAKSQLDEIKSLIEKKFPDVEVTLKHS